MTKTMEEAATAYSSSLPYSEKEKNIGYNGFTTGWIYATYGHPLSKRVTADEAEMIRKEYANTYPLDPDCGVANILIQGVLERIFGKDFFKEDKE